MTSEEYEECHVCGYAVKHSIHKKSNAKCYCKDSKGTHINWADQSRGDRIGHHEPAVMPGVTYDY